ncbi:hypothetical protein DFH09DRAFT_1181634 [Mycena vulgaris]|nr:hypothetical protein DFH09DRAFT_1181634 [Mycena vulgaris]
MPRQMCDAQRGELQGKDRKWTKAAVDLSQHIAQIIQQHELILKLARALLMLGRLQAQIQSTGRVFDIQVNCAGRRAHHLPSQCDAHGNPKLITLYARFTTKSPVSGAFNAAWQIVLTSTTQHAVLECGIFARCSFPFTDLALICVQNHRRAGTP